MKVIVCGAGQVGYNIARQLAAEKHDVVVIDQAPELVRRVADSLDVQAFVGFASHPDVLERAGAPDADMLIAVTYSDEVNMVACQVADSLFKVPKKFARVRHQSYLQPIWADLFSRDHLPIDAHISPEIEVARAISRRMQVPGAFDTKSFADGRVRLLGVHCDQDCPVVNTPLRQLTGIFPDLNITVVAIVRDGRCIVPDAESEMLTGDDVYFIAETSHMARGMAAFGREEAVARRVVIAGGGNIGAFLAEIIEKDHPGVTAKLIEFNRDRAHQIANHLEKTAVIHGDVIDPEILEEANVAESEAIIAVTNDDETNILASLLAKRSGTRRAITLINNVTYSSLVTTLGIDVVVNPRSITVSTILQHVRRGRILDVHSLGEGFGEIIEGEILETSGLPGKSLAEADLPDGVLIGAILRDGKVIIPRGDTVMRVNDRLVLFAAAEAVKAVEKLFAVRLEFI